MDNRDYREYYAANTVDKLIRDINNQQEAVWPALLTLIHGHSTWGARAVIEG